MINQVDYFKINKIIEEIIKSQDRIQELTLSTSKLSENNENLLKDLCNDINQNRNRLKLLKEFIQSEEIQIEKERKKREEEKKSVDNLIKELEEEIFKFEIFSKKLFPKEENSSIGLKLEQIFLSDYSDNINQSKQELIKLNEKKNRLIKNVEEYNNSLSELKESMQMLKEEKYLTESEIINLISQKESLDEMIHFNNFSLFKNIPLNCSLEFFNTSINLTRTIEIFPHEVYAINNSNKFSRKLHESIVELIQSELKSKKDFIFGKNLKKEKIEIKFVYQSDFEILAKKYVSIYKESKGLYSVDDFFILLTKKIFDYFIQTVENNSNFVIKEIHLERLRFYLKYFFKISYYDNLIANKINFLNKESRILKKEKMNKINDLEKRIESLNFSLDKLASREIQLKEKSDSAFISSGKNKETNQEAVLKLNTLRSLDNRMKSLIELKNELNCDIFNLNSEHTNNIRDYEEKMTQLEKINEQLKKKQNGLLQENNEMKINTNEEILKIRNSISIKFKEIKEFIRKEKDRGGNDILEYMKKYISKRSQTSSDIFMLDDCEMDKQFSKTGNNFYRNDDVSEQTTSRNQTFISQKNYSRTQGILTKQNVNANYTGSRLDFIKTFDHSKLNDFSHNTPAKEIKTYRSSAKHLDLSSEEYFLKSSKNERTKSKFENSTFSIEDLQNDYKTKIVDANYSNFAPSKLHQQNAGDIHPKNRQHKSRSIEAKPKATSQKMKEEETIKKHIQALKSQIDKNCFGTIGVTDLNTTKLDVLIEGSHCMKRTHDISQSQRYLESNNLSNTNNENYLLRLGYKRCYASLDKINNKILFTQDIAQTDTNKEVFSKSNFSYRKEEISLTDIGKTIVSKNMKNIIEVQQAIRKMQRNLFANVDYEFHSNLAGKSINLINGKSNQNFINNNFNLVIELVDGTKIEMILFTYEDYKAWLNGLAYVIKNYPKRFS